MSDVHSNILQNPSVINVGTISGGGAIGIWAWDTAMNIQRAGYKFEMIGGSSTGALVAYLISKGFFEEAELLYRLTYEQGSRNIFEPGLAKISDGKLTVSWMKILANVFKLKNVPSLMTNKGLYNILFELQKKKPGFDIPMFFNTVSLQSGKSKQHSSEDFKGRPADLCAAITASTSMPGIMPAQNFGEYKIVVDGGVTNGLPFKEMFQRMEPGKSYRFWNIMCNPIELLPMDELVNAAQIIGRTVTVMLNEILKGDLELTEDRNKTAKIIWPISEELDRLADAGMADEDAKAVRAIANRLRSALGYRNVPIHNINYSGGRGIMEFTMASYNEQRDTSRNDVLKYLDKIKNDPEL